MYIMCISCTAGSKRLICESPSNSFSASGTADVVRPAGAERLIRQAKSSPPFRALRTRRVARPKVKIGSSTPQTPLYNLAIPVVLIWPYMNITTKLASSPCCSCSAGRISGPVAVARGTAGPQRAGGSELWGLGVTGALGFLAG